MKTERLNIFILRELREALGMPSDSPDPEALRSKINGKLNSMSAQELFDTWLKWHGIIGYTETIMRALDNIRDACKP